MSLDNQKLMTHSCQATINIPHSQRVSFGYQGCIMFSTRVTWNQKQTKKTLYQFKDRINVLAT